MVVYLLHLYEAELPPVEHAVDRGDGGDRQERQQSQAHDPEGNVHLHPPYFLLIPGVLHIGVDLETQSLTGWCFIEPLCWVPPNQPISFTVVMPKMPFSDPPRKNETFLIMNSGKNIFKHIEIYYDKFFSHFIHFVHPHLTLVFILKCENMSDFLFYLIFFSTCNKRVATKSYSLLTI